MYSLLHHKEFLMLFMNLLVIKNLLVDWRATIVKCCLVVLNENKINNNKKL